MSDNSITIARNRNTRTLTRDQLKNEVYFNASAKDGNGKPGYVYGALSLDQLKDLARAADELIADIESRIEKPWEERLDALNPGSIIKSIQSEGVRYLKRHDGTWIGAFGASAKSSMFYEDSYIIEQEN